MFADPQDELLHDERLFLHFLCTKCTRSLLLRPAVSKIAVDFGRKQW